MTRSHKFLGSALLVVVLGLIFGTTTAPIAGTAEAPFCLTCETDYDASPDPPETWDVKHRFDSNGTAERRCDSGECHNEWRDDTCINNHPPCILSSIDRVRKDVTTAVAARPDHDPSTVIAAVVALRPDLRLTSDGRELQLIGCDGITHQRWLMDTTRGLVLQEVD